MCLNSCSRFLTLHLNEGALYEVVVVEFGLHHIVYGRHFLGRK